MTVRPVLRLTSATGPLRVRSAEDLCGVVAKATTAREATEDKF